MIDTDSKKESHHDQAVSTVRRRDGGGRDDRRLWELAELAVAITGAGAIAATDHAARWGMPDRSGSCRQYRVQAAGQHLSG